jgi:hypothetical protein
MGLSENWGTIAATCYPLSDGRGRDRKGKKGDSAGGPSPERDYNNAWPTLVFEAESLDELYNDMECWFRESNYQVKIVVLAKFDSSIIWLEKWEEEST